MKSKNKVLKKYVYGKTLPAGYKMPQLASMDVPNNPVKLAMLPHTGPNKINPIYSALPSADLNSDYNPFGGLGSALAATYNTFKSPLINNTGAITMANGPLVYLKLAHVNTKEELERLGQLNTSNTIQSASSGAMLGAGIGSIVPGIGTAIGGAIGAVGGFVSGLFGGSSRKRLLRRKIRKANEKIDNSNEFNKESAHTDLLLNEYDAENNNYSSYVPYNKGKSPFNTANPNALVGKGETIVDGNTGLLTEVLLGNGVGKDDVKANIKPQDAIAGNKRNPFTGNTFALDMKPLTKMESKLKRNMERNSKLIALNTEKLVKAYTLPLASSILQLLQYVLNGASTTPKYNRGKIGTAILNAATSLASVAPSIYNTLVSGLKPDYVSPALLYSPNVYGNRALSKMAKRRYNVNPELEQLRGFESRQRYNTRAFGSEGGVGRAMDVASALGTRRAISDVYAKKLNIDNDYISQEAQLMASLGAQQAQGLTGAMNLAYDINARNKAMLKQYLASGMEGFSQYALNISRDRNRKRMDDMRLRTLDKYLSSVMSKLDIKDLIG